MDAYDTNVSLAHMFACDISLALFIYINLQVLPIWPSSKFLSGQGPAMGVAPRLLFADPLNTIVFVTCSILFIFV